MRWGSDLQRPTESPLDVPSVPMSSRNSHEQNELKPPPWFERDVLHRKAHDAIIARNRGRTQVGPDQLEELCRRANDDAVTSSENNELLVRLLSQSSATLEVSQHSIVACTEARTQAIHNMGRVESCADWSVQQVPLNTDLLGLL